MESDGVDRAVAAVKAVAASLDLATHHIIVVHNSNKLALRLLPCDVFARVARVDQQITPFDGDITLQLAFEIDLAQQLAVAGAPVAALEARIEPQVYQHDGFAITWWTYHDAKTADPRSQAEYAHALQRLHVAMRDVDVVAPHFLDRVEEAEQLVANRDLTPELESAGRQLLLNTFASVRQRIDSTGAAEQLLHGEPHAGNILDTSVGALFVDLETCCFGPVEFDLAHTPCDVGEHYPDLDQHLLSECRRLVLAMVAAWRWDANDEFPDGLRHGRAMLDLLAAGPPWPALGDLRAQAKPGWL